jgi:spermidine/putrescine transport system permease protein
MSDVAVGRDAAPSPQPRGIGAWWRSPWRRPRFLQAITVGYLAWSILPVLIAIMLSFNAGRSNTQLQTFGLRWWIDDPDQQALFQDPVIRRAILQTFILSFITMLLAVPLGVAFAIGLDRWHGRIANGANFMMILTFVLPEITIGVSMLLVVQYLFTFVPLGTLAQIMGLVTFQISYPVIIVRARLLSIGREYEEAGMDLGASPRQSVRRVLLPLLYPAIIASIAIVFADTVDNFVTVSYLDGPADSQALSTFIYVTARASATPAVNAAATLMLVSTTIVIALGYVLYKRLTRGQEDTMRFSQQL